jgi:type I restriction enzyme M protein
MAKRHSANPNTLESIYIRMEELLLANSGEDEFEEILKILVIKLWSDMTKNISVSNLDNESAAKYINESLRIVSSQWVGVIKDTSSKIRGEQIRACFMLLDNYNFLSYGYEAIDALFEYIVSKEKKAAKGQFFTPRYIINHCVNIAKPQNGEVIIDPAAGSGAFLYQSSRYINNNTHTVPEYRLFAFDFDEKAVRICKLLMFVAQITNFKAYRVNSLITTQSQQSFFSSKSEESIMTIEDYLRINKLEAKADLILTNPPFAGEINEKEILDNYEVAQRKRRIERDVLFIERCINLLKPNGRMVIILPDNVFGSQENIFLRKWLYTKAKIVGVIGLPRNTFMPHTPVKTSILLLKKRSKKATEDDKIFFGISEQSGKNSRGVLQYADGKENAIENVAHDLAYIENEFEKFVDENKEWWI